MNFSAEKASRKWANAAFGRNQAAMVTAAAALLLSLIAIPPWRVVAQEKPAAARSDSPGTAAPEQLQPKPGGGDSAGAPAATIEEQIGRAHV